MQDGHCRGSELPLIRGQRLPNAFRPNERLLPSETCPVLRSLRCDGLHGIEQLVGAVKKMALGNH